MAGTGDQCAVRDQTAIPDQSAIPGQTANPEQPAIRDQTGSRGRPAGRGSGSVTEQVVRRIEQLVLGDLEPGAELPSESDLGTELGVSRLTVREAIKGLQARGLVEIHRGRRPTVAYPNARPIGDFFASAIRRDPRQLLDLLEVRRALEVHTASLAAQRASRAEVAAAESALAAMSQVAEGGDPDAIHAADIRFHESLAAASGNQLLNFLIEAMEGPLHASRLQSLRGHLTRGGSIADVIGQHDAILDRIRARDAAGAAAAMRDHLAQTARDLRAAFATLSTPEAETLELP
ncbi:FadR/GntR family transcriptional regulator [Rugosimonospora acidiphila]|uniref:FadR/GntR family transcriptional regulator n=1 Tax=Rugosimonospora acidiphila TaxID=556531 RepID=A0ABP9SSF3_9ACTN